MIERVEELPKLVLTDIDGVWTDCGMYYDNKDNELKKFNTYDSAGVLFCKLLGIPVGIITGENTEIVKRRADKLGVDYLFMGVNNKVEVVSNLLNELGLTFKDVAYIGDDINDMEMLEECGVSAVPSSAPSYMKDIAQHIMIKNGGEGVFREFVEFIIGQDGVKKCLEKYRVLKKFKQ